MSPTKMNPYVKTVAEVDAKWPTLKYLYYPNPFGVHPVLTGPEHGMYALHSYGEWGCRDSGGGGYGSAAQRSAALSSSKCLAMP